MTLLRTSWAPFQEHRTPASAGCCAISRRDASAPGASITHSYRSASRGSTQAARRAGTQQASRATPTNRTPTPISVSGSVGWTPKRNELKACGQRDRRQGASNHTRDDQAESFAENKLPNVALPGADRAADGDSRRREATESESTP